MVDSALAWLQTHSNRIILLLIVAACAALTAWILGGILKKALDRSSIPSASIFVNLLKACIWVIAAAMVLEPVFGINPTTLITALGIGGIAISLGLKDTISNIVGGFGLMLGKVIQPGDFITVNGTTGMVQDITWRQTVVRSRDGNEIVIPNSVLNTSALERITAVGESCVSVTFTVRAGSDLTRVERAIIAAVGRRTSGQTDPDHPPIVQFRDFSPYGIEGAVLMFAKPGVFASTLQDEAIRALANADFIEQRAATGTQARRSDPKTSKPPSA